jgi:hypothetical protein
MRRGRGAVRFVGPTATRTQPCSTLTCRQATANNISKWQGPGIMAAASLKLQANKKPKEGDNHLASLPRCTDRVGDHEWTT